MFTMKKTFETTMMMKPIVRTVTAYQSEKIETSANSALASLMNSLQDDSQLMQQRAELHLERLVSRYTILVDTCAIIHDKFPLLMQHMEQELRANQKKVMVPVSVINELKNQSINKLELRDRIRNACEVLQGMERKGLLTICSSANEKFGDKDLLLLASNGRTDSDLLVITQDASLSRDLLRLNDVQSVQGRKVVAYRINRYGFLTRNQPTEEASEPVRQEHGAPEEKKHEEKLPEPQVMLPVQWTETCKDCGRTFVITAEEAAAFRRNGHMLPRRCRPCRQYRNAMAQACQAN